MRFSRYLQEIEETTLRNQMMEILALLMKEAEPKEIEEVVYLLLGRLRPKFDRLEFSLAEKMVVRAIAQAVKKPVEEVTREYKRVGDLGQLVEEMKKEKELKGKNEEEVGEVYAELKAIAEDGGYGSQERKVARLAKLLSELSFLGARYAVRVVMGKLRLGFSDKTILDALSYMEYGSKEGRKELDSAYQVFPDVGKIAGYVKEGGIRSLQTKVKVTIGTPVMPALAQRLKTADEMIKKMGKVVLEPKFDGTRVQIHYSRKLRSKGVGQAQEGLFEGEVRMDYARSFTRNLDESSAMFPEIERLGEEIAAEEVILDTEAVGYDPKTNKMLPFQMTITRKRKHGVEEASTEVPLKFFVFDILYLDGKSLITLPLSERRKILSQVVKKKESGVLVLDDYLVTESAEEVRKYHQRQLAKGLEGAMVKKLEGQYLPGRQDFNWVKFKESEDSQAKLADTLDLIVMGYYQGRGKRAKFGLGAFLGGIRVGAQIMTIAKVGTGLSDEQFAELFGKLEKVRSKGKHKDYQVSKVLTPDVWVEPEVVVEVAADEVTRSSAHTAGVALRFPRLVKFRDDKDLSGVTTRQEVEEIAG